MNNKPMPIINTAFNDHCGSQIQHGFFTRQGGVSSGIYESLNLGQGSDDEPNLVLENRNRVAASFHITSDKLLTCYQVHSCDVVTVTAPFSSERPKADAMVTNVPGLALGILTADCGPLLFADSKSGIIGAAHAGWRGALYGIIDNTIAAMEALGSKREDIAVAVGPCIGPNNYEVGEEFLHSFLDLDANNMVYFRPSNRADHYFFNLWAFLTVRLRRNKVKDYALNLCTYADQARFFSYRRKTHQNEMDYGRQISAIMLGE